MAKIERTLRGNFSSILTALDNAVINGSFTATYEDGSDVRLGNVRCVTRVYERYSWLGGNRVSLTLTLVGDGETCHVTVITSGGSQAMFFKMNTLGEEAFLDTVIDTLSSLS